MRMEKMERRDGPGLTMLDDETVTRRFVEIQGRRVSYLTTGDPATAPTILLLHGSGVSARYWVNQPRGLERALRVVALDLPGHGQSEPVPHPGLAAYGDVAARLLDALGTAPVIAPGDPPGGAGALEVT